MVLSALVAAAGCGFELPANGALPPSDGGSPDTPVTDPDAGLPIDAPAPDAMAIQHKLYAASDSTLYAIDIDAQSAAMVGSIRDTAPHDVDGLAFDGTNLLGLTSGGGELLTIDPVTAAVTARKTITPAGAYGGLTVAPAGQAGPTAVLFAGIGNRVVRIDPTTGVATSLGMFGGGMVFFSDLAWVANVGLYATLHGGTCNTRCFARINATTGAATTFRTDLMFNLYGLSGYRGSLWALHSLGQVVRVDQTSGQLSVAFSTDIAWTEAAQ